MNGFISKQTVRRTLVFSTCLSLGFLTGFNFSGIEQLPAISSSSFSLNGIGSAFAGMMSKSAEEKSNTGYSNNWVYSKPITLEEILHPNKKTIRSTHLKIKSKDEVLNTIVAEATRLESIEDNQILLSKMKEGFANAVQSSDTLELVRSSASHDEVVINEPSKSEGPFPEINTIYQLAKESEKKFGYSAVSSQLMNTQKLDKSLNSTSLAFAEKKEILKVSSVKMNRSSFALSDCNLTPKIKLLKPIEAQKGEDSQVCPMRKTWISKDWNEEGWVKIETESYFPVLTQYPQPSSETTLLMDQNSVALMAIKAGMHFSRGTGMILGTVPKNYKIDVSGRSEDIQYFELSGTKYFFLMNVDLGANVVELVSESNPVETSTVFTPVIEDTVTYLDLTAPTNTDIKVKVVKEGKRENSDVSGLTVSLSTQTLYQSQSDSDGYSTIKKVPVVAGYPIFVDVTSKSNTEKSFQYRFELTNKQKDGAYHLKQYQEKTIFHWLKQVKTKLTEQNGMVIGEFDRKKLDGFKNHRFIRTDAITEKYINKTRTYTVLWDDQLSEVDPLEGDHPKFITVQAPEGLVQANVMDESKEVVRATLIPVSPRVINVISD